MPHDDLTWVRKLATDLSAELVEANKAGVRGVAKHVKASIHREIRGATGGNSRLSGARNARIGVKEIDDLGGKVAQVQLVPTGPIMLIERDTPPHSIYPRRRRALRFGGQFAASVTDNSRTGGRRHPGTKGKHPWERGVNKSRHEAGAIYDRAVQQAIREAIS
jgi:hypothetical protein